MHLRRSEINIQLFKRNFNKLYIFVEQPNKITGIVLRNPERRGGKRKDTYFIYITHNINSVLPNNVQTFIQTAISSLDIVFSIRLIAATYCNCIVVIIVFNILAY